MAVGQIKGTYRYYAICECSCGGGLKKIRMDGLTSGVTVSCGCFRLDAVSTHHLTKSIHYSRWYGMVKRCNDKSDQAYENYGGRGIKVCDRWMQIENFITDLPDGYFSGAEMDRIDNDGDYEPGNIRWATPSENASNRRSARLITFNLKTQSQRRWAHELGIPEKIINKRILNLGWTVEKALSTPVLGVAELTKIASSVRWAGHEAKGRQEPKTKRRYRTVEHGGKTITIKELSAITGITSKVLWSRIFERGWPVEKAVKP